MTLIGGCYRVVSKGIQAFGVPADILDLLHPAKAGFGYNSLLPEQLGGSPGRDLDMGLTKHRGGHKCKLCHNGTDQYCSQVLKTFGMEHSQFDGKPASNFLEA